MSTNQNLIELLDLILDLIGVAVAAEKDGKLSVDDLSLLIKVIPDVAPALSGIGEIPSELAALSESDALAITNHVMEKLVVTDAHAKAIVGESLKCAAACYGLIKAIRA